MTIKLKPGFWLLIAVLFTNCGSPKKTAYFLNQGNQELLSSNLTPAPVIEVNNLLNIIVTSKSPEATVIFNTLNSGASSSMNSASYGNSGMQGGGYLVSSEGTIKVPLLGSIKAAGHTTAALENIITQRILTEKLLLEPTVTVRNMSFKITVLGEVARPTVINVPSSRISLLEAIGMAGDLTIYGKRDNVLIIREENDKKITVRINLNNTSLFESPYYYLKANDVVYVEPNKAKVSSASKAKEVLPIVFGALSLTVILLDILTR
jgi:polysaccharide export outer membrane protein